MTVNIKGFDSGCHELFLLISKPDGAESPECCNEDLINSRGIGYKGYDAFQYTRSAKNRNKLHEQLTFE
jgi:hypothetical protein